MKKTLCLILIAIMTFGIITPSSAYAKQSLESWCESLEKQYEKENVAKLAKDGYTKDSLYNFAAGWRNGYFHTARGEADDETAKDYGFDEMRTFFENDFSGKGTMNYKTETGYIMTTGKAIEKDMYNVQITEGYKSNKLTYRATTNVHTLMSDSDETVEYFKTKPISVLNTFPTDICNRYDNFEHTVADFKTTVENLENNTSTTYIRKYETDLRCFEVDEYREDYEISNHDTRFYEINVRYNTEKEEVMHGNDIEDSTLYTLQLNSDKTGTLTVFYNVTEALQIDMPVLSMECLSEKEMKNLSKPKDRDYFLNHHGCEYSRYAWVSSSPYTNPHTIKITVPLYQKNNKWYLKSTTPEISVGGNDIYLYDSGCLLTSVGCVNKFTLTKKIYSDIELCISNTNKFLKENKINKTLKLKKNTPINVSVGNIYQKWCQSCCERIIQKEVGRYMPDDVKEQHYVARKADFNQSKLEAVENVLTSLKESEDFAEYCKPNYNDMSPFDYILYSEEYSTKEDTYSPRYDAVTGKFIGYAIMNTSETNKDDKKIVRRTFYEMVDYYWDKTLNKAELGF